MTGETFVFLNLRDCLAHVVDGFVLLLWCEAVETVGQDVRDGYVG